MVEVACAMETESSFATGGRLTGSFTVTDTVDDAVRPSASAIV